MADETNLPITEAFDKALEGVDTLSLPEVQVLAERKSGSSPETSIGKSPLTALERGAFGWLRTPDIQEKLLKRKFGPKNIVFVAGEGEGKFSIKQDDGLWYEADPGFKWDLQGMKQNLEDLPKDMAEFIGRYGTRIAGATAGAARAGASTAGLSPFIAVPSAIAGAGAGAAAAEAADIAARKAISSELDIAESPEEVMQRIGAAFLFGAETEAGGAFLKGAVKGLSGTLKRLSSTPEGKSAATDFLTMVAGKGEKNRPLIRARVENPLETASFDEIALKDVVNNTNMLQKTMQQEIEIFSKKASRALKLKGKALGNIERIADKGNFNPASSVDRFNKNLQELRITDNQGNFLRTTTDQLARELAVPEEEALKILTRQSNALLGKNAKQNKVTLNDIKLVTDKIDDLFSTTINPTSKIGRSIALLRVDLKNEISRGINELSPKLNASWSRLNSEFANSKNLVETLTAKSSPDKVDAFMKQIIKDDGTFNSELIGNISNLLKKQDPTGRLLRMQSARESTQLFQGSALNRLVPSGTPRGVAALSTIGGSATELGRRVTNAIPFAQQSLNTLKQLGIETRDQLLRDSLFRNTLRNSILTGALQDEQVDEVLKQVTPQESIGRKF